MSLSRAFPGPIRRNRSCISLERLSREYVKDIARSIVAEVGDRYEHAPEAERTSYFREATLKLMVAAQKATLEAFGIQFDTWFYESSLYESGEVDQQSLV